MKKIAVIFLIMFLCIISIAAVSAKENTHIEIEKSYDYGICVTLKDSSNNPIPSEYFDINITKPNGYIRELTNRHFNKTGECEFYLGGGGLFKIDVIYHGNDLYNPSDASKSFTTNKLSDSIYDYYDYNDYGRNSRMDDYMYDNFWYEEIYDDASNFDGEWY